MGDHPFARSSAIVKLGTDITSTLDGDIAMRCLLLFTVALIATKCLAQSPAPTPSSALPNHKTEFAVASVRENKSGGRSTSNVPLDRGNAYFPAGGILSATNQSFVSLLIFAYKINISEFRGGLMRRLPAWAVKDKFDILARAESDKPSKEDMRLMMQSLLEDRFKLKVHREKQQRPVLGLFLAKHGKTGPQLRPHDPAQTCSAPLPRPPAETTVSKMVGLWPTTCGDGDEERTSSSALREGGRDMTMSAIADWLTGSGEAAFPIQDRTGLNGTFDFIFDFDPESLGREGISQVPRADSGPTFTEAVKEQLGLQIKRREDGSISIFVVDNVEYPSAN
jgi:uncharacterized protein (TIGR03435 family)